MGKTKNSGTSVGTLGSPQGNFSQENLDLQISKLSSREEMLKPLIEAKVKFNPNEVLFVSRDSSGQMIWLEEGNENVGLKHIITHHSKNFYDKLGIDEKQILFTIKDILTFGKIEYIRTRNFGKYDGYEKLIYYRSQYYFLSAIGKNGFIVSIYPKGNNEAKSLIRRYKNGK